jgi:hypothetical protein
MATARSAELRTPASSTEYTPCCDSPCYISEWVAGKYVLKCINCGSMK